MLPATSISSVKRLKATVSALQDGSTACILTVCRQVCGFMHVTETPWRASLSVTSVEPAWTKPWPAWPSNTSRSEEHTSELQSRFDLVCRLLLEKKKRVVTQTLKTSHVYH